MLGKTHELRNKRKKKYAFYHFSHLHSRIPYGHDRLYSTTRSTKRNPSSETLFRVTINFK